MEKKITRSITTTTLVVVTVSFVDGKLAESTPVTIVVDSEVTADDSKKLAKIMKDNKIVGGVVKSLVSDTVLYAVPVSEFMKIATKVAAHVETI